MNVFRIDVSAMASGIPTAGSVPKTNMRMISAPTPPIIASVSTLGPVPPPLDASWRGSNPVRFAVTPAGAFAFRAARTSEMWDVPLKVFCPGG